MIPPAPSSVQRIIEGITDSIVYSRAVKNASNASMTNKKINEDQQ